MPASFAAIPVPLAAPSNSIMLGMAMAM
jgi:hypothetical protein